MRPPAVGVDVWTVDLAGAPTRWTVLSAAERSRAERFRRRHDRDRYAASHVALRTILATYTGSDPAALVFETEENGRPRLAGRTLSFSLSRAADMAVCAVATGGTVGVDVERVDPTIDIGLLARHWLSPRERRVSGALGGDERAIHFFTCWTALEARVKATGEGLAGAEASGRVHAALPPGWRVHHFCPDDGYVACLVTSDGADVGWRRWEAA